MIYFPISSSVMEMFFNISIGAVLFSIYFPPRIDINGKRNKLPTVALLSRDVGKYTQLHADHEV